ncbi:hypothetical protein KIN20_002966 [Parelaphostrongylus tenuis]|uniref:GDP-fucose pyrophosphorylase domain-containing protein n=1 Tax=Parelaphostrongylus tenuis TaxID=148309 RepID=A0AAD5QDB3_PARTN|nr:hypothetical protein KIN20_002966 [Parelaphostrongylus tenuis]
MYSQTGFSFFWMSWKICEQLEMLWKVRGPCTVETCCYGDFMRPLGYNPLLDYLEEGNSELSSWRKAFADIFSRVSPEIVNLGPDSFFHMGTAKEFQEHSQRGSRFSTKFLQSFSNNVCCTLINCSIGNGSLMEYCKLEDAQIGSGCLLSGCESSKPFSLDDNSILFTLCITNDEYKYVTILLHRDDDVKAEKQTLCWMSKETNLKGISLWNARLFPVERSREASLHATLNFARGEEDVTINELISIGEAVVTSDTQEMIDFRRRLKHEHLVD